MDQQEEEEFEKCACGQEIEFICDTPNCSMFFFKKKN